MKYGQLVRETVTVPTALTELSIDVRYDRSAHAVSALSLVAPEDVDKNLVLLYSRPVVDHESYRPSWAPGHEVYGAESCRQWVMVYRFMPPVDPERSEAISELLDKS
jgi:hypothetical protein